MVERYGALERGSIDIYRHYPQFTETVKQLSLQATEKMRLPGSATAKNYLAPLVLQRCQKGRVNVCGSWVSDILGPVRQARYRFVPILSAHDIRHSA
jgi:hypothetical protein